MGIFDTFVKDESIRKIYDTIEEREKNSRRDAVFHGWTHISHVIERAAFFMRMAGGSEEAVEQVKIAALFHDVGKLQGKKDHALKSYEFAKEYFKPYKKELPGKKEILRAIRLHSDGFDASDLLTLSLILADKLDQGEARLTEVGKIAPGIRQMQHIQEIRFTSEDSGFNEGCFVVDLITDGQMDVTELGQWKFTRKIFKAVRAYGRGLHRCPRIMVDGAEWDLHRTLIKLAFLQILPEKLSENPQQDQAFFAAQLRKSELAVQKAKELKADICLFPEMWSIGYQIPKDPKRLQSLAMKADSEWMRAFGQMAEKYEIAIAVSFLQMTPEGPKNSVILYDRYGRPKYDYSKVHTCDFSDEASLARGDSFPVVKLDTEKGSVNVGSMICFDREFPESARILMLKGAELVLVPNACPMEINRLSGLRTRANENMMAIATCNYPEGKPDCNGHSTLFDGVMYTPESTGSLDTLQMETGGAEGIYAVSLDLDKLRDYRAYEVHGNAYRRPSLYSLLLREEIREPFIRKDRRE
ncbi:MAG: HD domain-containing protein [Firmicutes bacterium]|nr:HD domain-containing protein [Bacillota bacterium]